MNADIDRNLGVRLREAREGRSVSQRELGEILGVDQSAVARLEAGERRMGVGEMVAACDYLAIPVDQLLEGDRPKVAFRAATEGADEAEARRVFRGLIDDFFAFEAAARGDA